MKEYTFLVSYSAQQEITVLAETEADAIKAIEENNYDKITDFGEIEIGDSFSPDEWLNITEENTNEENSD